MAKVCDGHGDCRYNFDEEFCGTRRTFSTTPASPDFCENKFVCDDGHCIYQRWVCDGEDDCLGGEDERKCNGTVQACRANEFSCLFSEGCIPNSWLCDGDFDCEDESDEHGCPSNVATTLPPVRPCNAWQFDCGDGQCISKAYSCDGVLDCWTGADEEKCNSSTKEYHVSTFELEYVNSSQAKLYWQGIQPDVTSPSCFVYILYRPKMIDTPATPQSKKVPCENQHAWFPLPDAPVMEYSVQVEVNQRKYPRSPYKTYYMKTVGAPRDVTFKPSTDADDRVILQWKPPRLNGNKVIEYTVYYTGPGGYEKHVIVPAERGTNTQSITLSPINDGANYTAWVRLLLTHLYGVLI